MPETPSQHFLAELQFRLKQGPFRSGYWLVDRLLDSHFDKRFGIRSSKRRKHEDLGFVLPDFEDYQPLSYLDLRSLLDPLQITSSDVFLDYGCGMGRPVCVAATYPFKAVMGVELSPDLCHIAERNVAVARSKFRTQEVAIINANAADFNVPDEVNFIFFFNPFGGDVLASALNRIGESLQKTHRNLRLVFCGTVSTERFRAEAARHEWLSLEAERSLKTGVLALQYTTRY